MSSKIDLEAHRRENERATQLLKEVASVRHRMLIAIEHQHLNREIDAVSTLPPGGLDSSLQKRGILVRHEIYLRSKIQACNTNSERVAPMNPFNEVLAKVKMTLMPLVMRVSSETEGEVTLTDSERSTLTAVELMMETLVSKQRTMRKQELRENERRKRRIEAFEKRREFLLRAVQEAENELGKLEEECQSRCGIGELRTKSRVLGRRVEKMLEAMPILSSAWSATHGEEEAYLFLQTLQSLMNDSLNENGGVPLTESLELSHVLSYFFLTGLIKSHPTSFGKLLLNCTI